MHSDLQFQLDNLACAVSPLSPVLCHPGHVEARAGIYPEDGKSFLFWEVLLGPGACTAFPDCLLG